jgi:hypothetical protein
MYYPDTLHAALWIILAVMAFWSVVSAVLIGLVQRFASQEKSNRNSVLSAPRTTPMRRPVDPTKFAELSFLLLLGAVVVAGIDARAAHAFDAETIDARAPGHWCVTREGSGVPPACKYENFLTCGMAAIIAGASCKKRLSLPVTAGAVPLSRARKLSVAKAPLQTRAIAPVSRNDGLFRKFVRWSGGAPPPEATTIVVSAEPATLFTSTKPGPSEAEPAKLETGAVEPSTQQAHAPGAWLIQIGAYDGEADAKQHLSEAQLKASTALAAAAPFTERVQVGDKVLYRARFAGFDKGAAESACKQLKRGHFQCMTLQK